MDAGSQARFEALRQEHYPAALNQIAAHLTLFHTLPETDEIRTALEEEAAHLQPFAMRVSGLRSLGRGVALSVESAELVALHRRLSARFAAHLSRQDQGKFWPHVVVQNKASGAEAKELLARLGASFAPWQVQAEGLGWWEYLGGPWRWREGFAFTV